MLTFRTLTQLTNLRKVRIQVTVLAVPVGKMIHSLGLPRLVVKKLFETSIEENVDEDQIAKWFGRKTQENEQIYSFLDGDGFTAAPLQEFGKISLSKKARGKILQNLPDFLKEHIPADFTPGFYLDKKSRIYKFESDVDSSSSMWTVAIPRGKLSKMGFPEINDRLKLFKESSQITFLVIDIQPVHRNTTLIHLLRA